MQYSKLNDVLSALYSRHPNYLRLRLMLFSQSR